MRILVCYAHPDDEVLGPGATIRYFAEQGASVEMVLTTRGEAGEISDPALATPETLPQVREQEALCSAKKLGIQQIHFMGYRDSGMDGTEENKHPHAYINQPDEAVVSRLVKLIRTFKPHIILTFEPYGGYGHPDHKAINRHTLAAYDHASDPTYQPELGAAWQVSRLFYPLLGVEHFEEMRERMNAHGLETKQLDRAIAVRGKKGWPRGKYTVVRDVATTVDAKWQAGHCHATQWGGNDSLFRRLSDEEMKQIFSTEYFYLARSTKPSELADGFTLPDLFAGVDITP